MRIAIATFIFLIRHFFVKLLSIFVVFSNNYFELINMDDIFHSIDRFMRNMDAFDQFFFNNRPSVGFDDPHNFSNRSLRDRFIDQNPNFQQIVRPQDRDFDDIVDKHGIESIFDEDTLMERNTKPFNSFSKSFQFTRVMGNDGVFKLNTKFFKIFLNLFVLF